MAMKIVAAVDRSPFSDTVTDMVIRIARRGTNVLLINVAPREADVLGKQIRRKEITDPVPEDLQDRRDLLDNLTAGFREHRIKCETLLIRGQPGPTIVAEARRWAADLIVMGTHGRGKLHTKVMGSVCESVLESRVLPVLVTPLPRGKE